MSSTSTSRKPHVVGGKLKLKGSSGSSGAKRSQPSATNHTGASSHTFENVSTAEAQTQESTSESGKASASAIPGDEFLTPSQRRHMARKIEKEREEAKKLSKTSFRDRVDIFNNKLAAMTEHNDIPRISAAGNG